MSQSKTFGLCAGALLALCATAATAQTIVVQRGDTLSTIAREQFGDVLRWRELCDLNRDVIGRDCNTIRPGITLDLPGDAAVARSSTPPAQPEVISASDPAPVEPVREETVSEESDSRLDISPADIPDGEVVFNFATMSDLGFQPEAGFTVERAQGADFVTLSGNVADANPGGNSPGIAIDLGRVLERSAAGRTVQIDALVRLSEPGSFRMAYSTNSNGNSGWQVVQAADAFGTISWTYDVPTGAEGSDFLGILPDPDATGQTLDISFLAVTVIE